MGLLSGKKALILGVANERSIAWGITQQLREHGAQVALTYLNDALKKRVLPLAEAVQADWTCEVDVTKEEHYASLFETVKREWGNFDILIHSLAYAEKDDLQNRFVMTSRAGFQTALDISAYSLIGLCQQLYPLMNAGGSVIALTYYGSQKVLKGYNVMGVAKAALEANVRYLADDLGLEKIRVNAISAGAIRTLAASGVPGLRDIFKVVEEKAPLHENVTTQDVAGAAVYLAGPLSQGVTGQILYVDAGMSILGL
jgi:enoyl-[acyl-carrier protein] reductase I